LSIKKINFVIWRAQAGGAEKIISDSFEKLKKDYIVNIISLKPVNKYNSVFKNQFNNILSGKKESFFFAIVFYLKQLIINKNVIYHLHNTGPLILLLTLLFGSKKVVYHIHGTIHYKKYYQKIFVKILWKTALLFKPIIIANSRHSRNKFFESITNYNRILIIPNPFILEDFVYKEKFTKKIKKIIYVGRLIPVKNLKKWIDCAEFLYEIDNSIKFEIIGEGPLYTELSHKIREKKLEHTIKLSGFESEVNKKYHEADLLLFLSLSESFGNVVVESVLCGTPVISLNIEAMKEIFENYPENLIFLDKELNMQIKKKVFNEYNTLIYNTKRANIEFRKRFSMKKYIEKTKQIYETI